VMQGVEHDEAISIYALQMQARRLLRRHYPSPLSPTLTPRNDNSQVFNSPIIANGHYKSSCQSYHSWYYTQLEWRIYEFC
jgi:hypothetical protein